MLRSWFVPQPIVVYEQGSLHPAQNRKRVIERFVVSYEAALQLVETPKSERSWLL